MIFELHARLQESHASGPGFRRIAVALRAVPDRAIPTGEGPTASARIRRHERGRKTG